jgi:hypothetical protein
MKFVVKDCLGISFLFSKMIYDGLKEEFFDNKENFFFRNNR